MRCRLTVTRVEPECVLIDQVLRLHHGCARFKDLTAAGVSREQLRAAVSSQRVVRVHRGCYALPEASRVRQLATVFRGHLTCVTWARNVGLPVERPEPLVHLGVPSSRALGRARERPCHEVLLHRGGDYDADFAIGHLDVSAACTTPIQQLAMVEAALSRGMIVPSELSQLTSGTMRRRQWLRRRVRVGVQSLGETYARIALQEAGLDVVPQVCLPGVGTVDLVVEGRLVVEIDGYTYHSGQAQFANDRERDRSVNLMGLTPVRFTHADAVERLPELVEEVKGVLWRVGGSPPTLRTRMARAARDPTPMWWR